MPPPRNRAYGCLRMVVSMESEACTIAPQPASKVLTACEVAGTRIAHFACDRGFDMARESCPHTQFWLVLSGVWTEMRNRKTRRLDLTTTVAYAPKEACRRMAEEPVLAFSVQLPRGTGAHSDISLPWQQTKALWQLAR